MAMMVDDDGIYYTLYVLQNIGVLFISSLNINTKPCPKPPPFNSNSGSGIDPYGMQLSVCSLLSLYYTGILQNTKYHVYYRHLQRTTIFANGRGFWKRFPENRQIYLWKQNDFLFRKDFVPGFLSVQVSFGLYQSTGSLREHSEQHHKHISSPECTTPETRIQDHKKYIDIEGTRLSSAISHSEVDEWTGNEC
jgi:hypothetical protein